jgi:protein phosphatase
MLDIQFGQASDFGKVRTNNEDACGSFVPQSRSQGRSHGFLFVVADGVGGYDFGEVASATAVRTLVDEFSKASPGAMLPSLMPRLVQEANAAVHDCALQPEYRGKKIATTLVACALRYDQAVIAHVGDSRCYLIRNGQVRQLTQDHSLVNEQHKLGLISSEEMASSEARHVLVRSVGPEMFVSADIATHTIQPDDIFVLCSDGLHNEMPTDEMARIVTQHKPMEEVAHELVARAVEIDGGDNTTAQVIRVRAVEQVGMYRGRPYRLSSL